MASQSSRIPIDPVRALALYDVGASDNEIAAALGASQSGVCRWRKRHGLARRACNDNRLTASQIRQAQKMLRNGATKAQVAAELAVSVNPIDRIRRGMKADGLRQWGWTNAVNRKAVIEDPTILKRITKAIGSNVPPDIRMDAVNDMYLELLEGKLPVSQIESAAPRFRSRAFSMGNYNYSTRSLDEEDENGFTLADRIADPDGIRPFDEILERVFANDN